MRWLISVLRERYQRVRHAARTVRQAVCRRMHWCQERVRERLHAGNLKVASALTNFFGNMWTFWAALVLIVVVHLVRSQEAERWLFLIENDLQLLLLVATSVTGAMQLRYLMNILQEIHALEKQELHEISGLLAAINEFEDAMTNLDAALEQQERLLQQYVRRNGHHRNGDGHQ